MTLGTILEDDEEITHIVPLNDLREHETSCDCWCKPVPDEEDATIVVHNSADHRELCEGARTLH